MPRNLEEPHDVHPTMLDASTPDGWLLAAYDSGWMRAHSNTSNRVGLADIKEEKLSKECYCAESAMWPLESPMSYRALGPSSFNGGIYEPTDLFTMLMNEDIDTLSPLKDRRDRR